MNPQRLKRAYERLQVLDDRLTYKIRPRSGGGLSRPGPEQLEEQMRTLSEFTLELKGIVEDLVMALATRPKQND